MIKTKDEITSDTDLPYRICSFDLDGCLYTHTYLLSPLGTSVVESNSALLNSIKEEKKNFSKLIVMLGSTRQSLETDFYNSINNKTEYGFIAIKKVSDNLGAEFDNFLLADAYGYVKDGTSYDKAIEAYKNTNKKNTVNLFGHHTFISDEAKINILYAQIHRSATKYPNKSIIFDFYDDRRFSNGGIWRKPDILEHLKTYFTRHPHLIPSNVTLRLNHYDSRRKLTMTGAICGTGLIDENYKQTIIDMTNIAAAARPACMDFRFFSNSILHVKPKHLVNRSLISPTLEPSKKQQSICSYLSSCVITPVSFFRARTNLYRSVRNPATTESHRL